MRSFIFSSESVSEGHPDKIADQISDAIVDDIIAQTPPGERDKVRVACETLVKGDAEKGDHVIVAGEFRAPAADKKEMEDRVQKLARQTIRDIGYDRPEYGFDGDGANITNLLSPQSGDIAVGVDQADGGLGAGDQGIMFGYACRETESLMPLPIDLAHALMRRHAKVRRDGTLPWLRPDAKAQVSVRYENGKPREVTAVVLSAQHDEKIDGRKAQHKDRRIEEAVREIIIKPVLNAVGDKLLTPDTEYHINPTGLFVLGGPAADCGLTGRKIIVDTYGGAAPHGGGAFSGKDPTKVDRSATYALRRVAKSVVAAGLADKCLVQAAYAIGEAQPVSIMVDTFGTGDNTALQKRIAENFDLTPGGIIREMNLWRPIYRRAAAYGHFGRDCEDGFFPWEKVVALL